MTTILTSTGDTFLVKISNQFNKMSNDNISFYRIGGDEFFILTKGLEKSEIYDLCKEVMKTIHDSNIPTATSMSASFGVIKLDLEKNGC